MTRAAGQDNRQHSAPYHQHHQHDTHREMYCMHCWKCAHSPMHSEKSKSSAKYNRAPIKRAREQENKSDRNNVGRTYINSKRQPLEKLPNPIIHPSPNGIMKASRGTVWLGCNVGDWPQLTKPPFTHTALAAALRGARFSIIDWARDTSTEDAYAVCDEPKPNPRTHLCLSMVFGES